MIQLDRRASLHLVLESTELVRLSTSTRSEVALLTSLVLRVTLLSESRSCVVSLVPVGSHLILRWSSSLGQSPSWEVLLVRWFSTSLWDVSSWAHTSGSGSLVLQCLTSSKTKGVLFWPLEDGLFFGQILRPWVLLQVSSLEARFSSDLGSQTPFFSSKIGFDWVVKEQGVLVEVVLGLVLSDSDFGSHGPSRGL